MAISSGNLHDRLELCWGRLEDWRNLKIVQKSKEWLEKVNASFTPTTFIAYRGGRPVGMIEFGPLGLLETYGFCPCRAGPNAKKEIEVLGKQFGNYLFISCLWVKKESQGKGVGKALLDQLLMSEALKNSDGLVVFAAERDVSWDESIHWPAGPKEFYLKAGFVISRVLKEPAGHLLCYRNKSLRK